MEHRNALTVMDLVHLGGFLLPALIRSLSGHYSHSEDHYFRTE